MPLLEEGATGWLPGLVVGHACATWFLVGLIWIVQLVHYPLMDGVGVDGWVKYGDRHRARITLIVAPMMFVELACAAALVVLAPGVLSWLGAGLLAVVWLSTFAVQVPLHAKLASVFDVSAHAMLVRTNWVRTAAWSARGALAALMLV